MGSIFVSPKKGERWAREATLKKYSGRDSERRRLLFPHMSGTQTQVEEETTSEGEELSAEEERVIRMRAGASLSGKARLESKVDCVAPEHRERVLSELEAIEEQALEVIESLEKQEKKNKIVLRLLEKDEQ